MAVDQIEIRVLAADGTERTVLHSGVVLPSINCMLAIYIDLTTRKRDELQLTHAQREAREHEVLYPLLLNHTREMLVLSSSSKVRCFVSPAVSPLLGWSQEEYLAQSLGDLVHAEDREAVLAMRGRCRQDATSQMLRHRMLHKNGSWLWVETLVSCYKDPATQEIMGYVATVRDDSHRKAEEAKHAAQTALLERQAHYDNLTGLANRHLFYSTLHEEARRQSRRAQSLALLLVDVDYFKAFNDRYGHLEGDRVLQRVAAVLKTSAHRIADLAARFGGEEFVLFLPMTEPEGAAAIAQNTIEALAAEAIPHIGSPAGLLTISIGIACWPASTALDCDKLLLHADRALYKAKRSGRNQFCKEYCGDTELEDFLKLHVPKSHEIEALQRTGMEGLLPEAG